MFRPLFLALGLRFFRASKRCHSGFVSFISLISVLGIALGVMVLLTVLSVMNGFDYEIKQHIFSMARHVVVRGAQGALTHWAAVDRKLKPYPHIKATAPFVDAQALLIHQGRLQPVAVVGVCPEREQQVSSLGDHMVSGGLDRLHAAGFGIVMSHALAWQLHLDLGDRITVLTPEMSHSPMGMMPRLKRFTLVGVFDVPSNEQYLQQWVLVHLSDAQTLFHMGQSVSGLRLRITDLYGAAQVSQALSHDLGAGYRVRDWTQHYGALFRAIHMEKNMMCFILMLIIAVAAFNLVASLVMLVRDKQADIAILRTMGLSSKAVWGIFVVQGGLIGCLGCVLGLASGIFLSLHVTEWVRFLEQVLGIHFLSESVYFVNFLPARLLWSDVVLVGSLALGMSVLATGYPAYKAARVQPAEALRYE